MIFLAYEIDFLTGSKLIHFNKIQQRLDTFTYFV